MSRLSAPILLLCFLLAVTALTPPGKGKGKGKGVGLPMGTTVAKAPDTKAENIQQLGKLRESLMTWYCPQPGNSEMLPCQTFTFMKDLRATKSPEEKKKKLAARAEMTKSKTPEERLNQQKKAKEAYVAMYKGYCGIETNVQSDVCKNVLLKNLYNK